MEPKDFHVHKHPHHLLYHQLCKNKQYQKADVGNNEFSRGLIMACYTQLLAVSSALHVVFCTKHYGMEKGDLSLTSAEKVGHQIQ